MSNNKKKWTFMVYMAGDNNLDNNGVIDLNEMKNVGSTNDVNVIAEFDRYQSGAPTRRFYLKKGTSINADVVQSLGEINTGDPAAITDFINWGVDNYPAEHYILVLWNHGQGWDDTDIYAGERGPDARLTRPSLIRHALFRTTVEEAVKRSAADGEMERAILLDDNAKDFLDNLETKKILNAAKTKIGHKIDILGMDACLMSMAEVLYQMKDTVLYTVGSEETEPLDGWPYDAILNELSKKPNMTPDDLSKLIVQKYIESYKGSGEAVTHSACDLMASSKFANAFKNFSSAMKTGLNEETIRTAMVNVRNRVQDYNTTDNVDLVDLCQLLKTSSVPTNIKNTCEDLISTINGNSGLVITSGSLGTVMEHSHGVAIYFPTRLVSPLYAGLDFAKETGWGDFLKKYVEVTRSR
jgi:hypothetical protein